MQLDATETSLLIALAAFIVSIISLLFTIKAFMSKSGEKIKGSFGTCSDIACDDKYICNIVLENQKDRAVIIYKIYLRIGYNYYVVLEDHETDPLVLEPFKVYAQTYQPLDFYSVSQKRIILDKLLDNKHVKKHIVLSTTSGKYKVKSRVHHWDAISAFFKNHMIATITPMRSMFKDKSYGLNAKYIIEFEYDDGNIQDVPIYPMDFQIRKFKDFVLTQKSLASKENLEEYLNNMAKQGVLKCKKMTVHNIEAWHNEIYEMDKKKVVEAKYYNWFFVSILGPIYTRISNVKLNKKNESIIKKAKKQPNKKS